MQIRLLLAFQLFAVSSFAGVDQVARWNTAQVRTVDVLRADKAVFLFQRTRARYEAIEKMRVNGAPATVLFALHYRESDNNFNRHAHEGSPLTHRTRDEPKGRPLHPDPPYTFEISAEDAYYVCDRLDLTNWKSIQSALDRTEKFNGLGYRSRGVVAPYNFAATSLYSRGKFVADHRFDPNAVDKQLGVVAILKAMQARGIALPFQ